MRAIPSGVVVLILAFASASPVAAQDTADDPVAAENPFVKPEGDETPDGEALPDYTEPPPPPPARGGAFPIEVDPAALVLGSDGEAAIEIRVAPDSGPLKLFAALGSITEPELAEPGVYRATYTPPDQFMPQLDFVAAAALVGGRLVWAYAAIPLVGQGEAKIKTRKYANAVIYIRDKLYGPVKANRKGKAKIQVQVPPGTFHGFDGEGQEVDLHVPLTQRTAIFAATGEVDMNDPRPVLLAGVAVGADGGPCEDCEDLEIWASSGRVEDVELRDDGTFTASFVAAEGSSGTVDISAGPKGDSHPATTIAIEVIPKKEEAPPPPPPPPPPPLEVPWLNSALKLGYATNFGSLSSFAANLDLGVRLPVLDGRLGLGAELGFALAVSRASASVAGTEFQLSSYTWVVPMAGTLWFRQPLTPKLGLLISAQGAGVLLDNKLERTGGNTEHERGFHPGVGGALALEVMAGAGAVVLEARYLWVGGESETIKGQLSTLFANVGYRFFFL